MKKLALMTVLRRPVLSQHKRENDNLTPCCRNFLEDAKEMYIISSTVGWQSLIWGRGGVKCATLLKDCIYMIKKSCILLPRIRLCIRSTRNPGRFSPSQ